MRVTWVLERAFALILWSLFSVITEGSGSQSSGVKEGTWGERDRGAGHHGLGERGVEGQGIVG